MKVKFRENKFLCLKGINLQRLLQLQRKKIAGKYLTAALWTRVKSDLAEAKSSRDSGKNCSSFRFWAF